MGVGAGTSGGSAGGRARARRSCPAAPSGTAGAERHDTAPAPMILRGGGTRGGTIQAPSRRPRPTTDGLRPRDESGRVRVDRGAGHRHAGLDRRHGRGNARFRQRQRPLAPPRHNWKAHTGEVRGQWGLPRPPDVDSVGGDRGNLVRLLQRRVSAAVAETEVQGLRAALASRRLGRRQSMSSTFDGAPSSREVSDARRNSSRSPSSTSCVSRVSTPVRRSLTSW